MTSGSAGAEGPSTVTMGRFRTRQPARSFGLTATTPQPGETVGIGMPVILDFDTPV
ncbi:Ig-like domain-containing protein, partial [Nonomuraea ceibae]|uniref:Ig-like domain-containing protein n=1 Tax=Nonomuraea ceibae TaxID=1935170 RepID=UPI002484AEF6